MDFFDAQDRARKISGRLVLLFGLAVAAMMALVYFVALFALELAPVFEPGMAVEGPRGLVHPELAAAVVLGMGALIGIGASVRTAQLRKGGAVVAELLGGRRVDPATPDPGERMLLNVVEEMSIASGVSVPAVFVMDGEDGINAFAAGHTADDAAVAVTRGALDALTRDELQGVVAHEFSHILNGDMRLNVRLMGLLFGILLLAIVGRGILRGAMWGPRSRSGGGRKGGGAGQIAILGVALVAVGYLGVLFGRLIQAAVSRQREYLADAAAVEFTRNPSGLAGALKRIGAAAGGSRIRDHHAQEAGHLFFAGGTGRALTALTSTHPPLRKRISRIDPRWDGSFDVRPKRASVPGSAAGPPAPGSAERAPAAGAAGRSGPLGPLGSVFGPATDAAGALPPGALAGILLGAAGDPREGHVAWARRLLESVPDELRAAVRTPEGAVATVLALLLDGEQGVRAEQRARIADALGDAAATTAASLEPSVSALGAEARLPLLELALPSLRDLPADRAAALRTTVGALIRSDGRVRTFEFALYHLVGRALAGAGGGDVAGRRHATTPLARLRDPVETLLSAVARSATGDEAAIRAAFEAGAGLLPETDPAWRLQPAEALGLDRVDEALARMESSAPSARKVFLTAAAAVVHADGTLEVEEVEMVRAIAEALEVPLPPLLPATPG